MVSEAIRLDEITKKVGVDSEEQIIYEFQIGGELTFFKTLKTFYFYKFLKPNVSFIIMHI